MFTVVTPTFNRLPLLRRCFESLIRQTCTNFEWLVVDDGSTDGTGAAVALWREEASFPIRILEKENGGKHTAVNKALDVDLRKFVLLLDSDDMLADDAIELLHDLVETHRELAFAGVIGNCHSLTDRSVIGRAMPIGLTLTTGRELRERWGITGDTLRIYASEVIRRFRLPEFAGERFVPENVLFDRIDRDGLLLVAHGVLSLCEYQEHGLSAGIMRHRARSPLGFAASLESTAWISRQPRNVVLHTLKYQVWCRAFFGSYRREHFRRQKVFYACLPASALLFRLGKPEFIFDALAGREHEQQA